MQILKPKYMWCTEDDDEDEAELVLGPEERLCPLADRLVDNLFEQEDMRGGVLGLQGSLAHKKSPPSLGPPLGPRHSPTAGERERGVPGIIGK